MTDSSFSGIDADAAVTKCCGSGFKYVRGEYVCTSCFNKEEVDDAE